MWRAVTTLARASLTGVKTFSGQMSRNAGKSPRMLPRDPPRARPVPPSAAWARTPRRQTSTTSAATSSPSRPCATLGELGYARTSLREIAQNSEFSHGVVHYYFADKIELITYCVRYYKATCVTRYDDVVADRDHRRGAGRRGFADKLVETITDEAPMHRLWYDLRTQSMFEPELREAVLEIDRTLEHDDLADRPPLRRPARRRAGRSPRPPPTPCSTGCSRRACCPT